jgi:hypothetical protein
VVANFLKTTMTIFGGKIGEAESTLMPEVRSWVRSMTQELGPSPDGTAVILFINLPGMGILGASAKSFLLSFVTNMLADFPENSVALLVHSNRASQQEGRTPMVQMHLVVIFIYVKEWLAWQLMTYILIVHNHP